MWLVDLRRRSATEYFFISHDGALFVRQVAVMYIGKLCEVGGFAQKDGLVDAPDERSSIKSVAGRHRRVRRRTAGGHASLTPILPCLHCMQYWVWTADPAAWQEIGRRRVQRRHSPLEPFWTSRSQMTFLFWGFSN